MRIAVRISVLILAITLAGSSVGSLGCGNDSTEPEPESVCDRIGVSADGTALLGDCCDDSFELYEGTTFFSYTCSNGGCSEGWSIEIEWASGQVTSYRAVFSDGTVCTGP